MPDSGWSVRLFKANDYSDEATIDFLSNYKKGKSRQLDSIITYSGMYGIDNYLVWNLHKDLPSYDFSTVALDLKLFMYKSVDIAYFQDFYRVQDIRYNPKKSQYTLYAVSETTVRLHSKLIKYGVTSLSYKEDRTAKQVLKEIIQENNIFYVVFHDDGPSTKDMIHYQYRYFDIDPEWTVLDFIEYIANDNQYEWCVTTFVDKGTNKPYFFLQIGHELKASKHMNATKPYNIETDNISESVYTMKITTNGSPMQPLSHWEEDYKCLWSKHTTGKAGGISRGCFAPMGMGHFDKSLYLRTLEGNIEKNIGYSMLTKSKRRFSSIGIGNILKDEGDPQFIDQVSIQKNPKAYSIREPHNILISRGEDIAVQHQLEKATRSTPYLDHEAGLLFPSPNLDNPPPNSLVFNVDGKRESAIVGGYVYGDGRQDEDGNKTLKIPFKEKEDFRMRFSDGAEIFYDHSAQIWFFQAPKGFAFKNVVTPYDKNTTKHLNEEWDDGKSMLQIYENNLMFDSQSIHMHLMDGGCFQVVPKTGPQPDDPYRRYAIVGDNEAGDFYIEAKNNVYIEIRYKDGLDSGTITINTTGTVNIGADASAVNIAGGGKKLSHGTHTHTTPVAIPGPPQTSTPTSDNTTKTEAD